MARKDLNKLLCERGRRGGGETKGRHKAKGVSAWPFKGESTSPFPYKEGIKAEHLYDNRKEFNENLNPLWGLLRKSVGKKWDKVYGEICKTFDKRKVVNQHILVHLFQNVEVNTFMNNGKVSYTDTRFSLRGITGIKPISESNVDYYVHPVSGILLANKKATWKQIHAENVAKKKQEEEKHLQLISRFNNKNGNGARYAININDVWYEISVVKTPEPTKHRRTNAKGEVEYYTHFPAIDAVSIHGAKVVPGELRSNGFYVCRKEQLNKKRLKELGLK